MTEPWNDPVFKALERAFAEQLKGNPRALAFEEDGGTNYDQFYVEGVFRLKPVVEAVKAALAVPTE
jgi:hypothetical protein